MPVASKQRRFPRYPIQLPLLHKAQASASADAGVGWTRDLSEGGICVELAGPFPPTTPLQIRLRTDLAAIELEARVVWASKSGLAGGAVFHGVVFTQVSPHQQQALKDLIFRKGELLPVQVRVPLKLSVLCQRKGETKSLFQGWTGDISRGGLLLHLNQVLPPDTEMELTLRTPNGPLTMEAATVWIEPPERRTPGQPIRHGIRFTGLGWSTSLSLGLVLSEAAS